MNKKLLKATGVALFGGALIALSSSGIAGIANTKHNLGVTGTGTNHLTTGTAEICVFCHTPHGADTGAVVPLWNKTFTPGAYQTYDTLGTSSLDGAVAQVGSVSVACLSCHDGTQAMDTVINAPGSGGYDPLGARMATDADWAGSAFLNGTTITSIGTDLRNDHPVSIQYGGGGVDFVTHPVTGTASQSTAALGDTDFVQPYGRQVNGTPVWWVETGTGTERNKTDMQLYTRDGNNATDVGGSWTGSTELQPFVECASCHDPHVEDQGSNPTFLRISNDSSAVCLACHIK